MCVPHPISPPPPTCPPSTHAQVFALAAKGLAPKSRDAEGFLNRFEWWQQLKILAAQSTVQEKLPDIAKKKIAFYRIWCLVELAAALQKSEKSGMKPVRHPSRHTCIGHQ